MCDETHQHKLKALRLECDSKSKRTVTILWIKTVKDVLRTNIKTADLLENYPELCHYIPTVVNKALGSFLQASVAHDIKNMLSDIDPKVGLRILRQLCMSTGNNPLYEQ